MNPRKAFEQVLEKQGTIDPKKVVGHTIVNILNSLRHQADNLQKQVDEKRKEATDIELAWHTWDIDALVRFRIISSSQGQELKEFIEEQKQ